MKVGSKIIIDASVALKWALPEHEDMEQALLLKQDLVDRKFLLVVPAHFMTEVFNTLFRKKPEDALSYLSFFLMAPFQHAFLSLEIASISGSLMKRYPNISFYDAFYHALAIHKEGTFVTADEQYYKLVKKEGHILLLKDYK
jgi:predicted nucleic acid-binding protein